jgi:NAD(P)-dependent dehydrogenase (short-subunit alcohol dehydrogenase family)
MSSPAYVAAKHGVVDLTNTVALEAAVFGFIVNAVYRSMLSNILSNS